MLDQIVIDEAVQALRPDFAVLLMTAEGLANGSSDGRTGDVTPSEGVDGGHVEAWREAYRGFGVNPKRARPSVDALLRRGDLPEINRVVDAYNVVSVRFELPIGGEDLDAYDGPARLVRAAGDEPFDTVKNGEAVVEHPEPGEVIWRDGTGVTCRRWNWRQCTRTRITEQTKNALFILERLEPHPLDRLRAAGDALAGMLTEISPDVVIRTRLLEP
ncbi:B3/B4 domain-containing protein [Actinoallomurus soli]|uniref:B3/B4 domain-containing protein n=1 Tax=Actinoallomurus soli TaxID=2952535 RepID=UPI00209283A8|nr:phenylalanine--tRNA ligase beta subunit-related protein [Actinoallomurus soli]MCO5970126.1 phenylalanine--tRNA ligase beta subunit-related protein [Actinoallomurus soli]